MAHLGVLFSLDKETISKLKSFKSDEDKLDFFQEDIEEEIMNNDPNRFAELDKSWDALHRSLTDGKLDWSNGAFPLNHIVLGGEQLYKSGDYILSLKTPELVNKIAKVIEEISIDDFRKGYNRIDSKDYGYEKNEEDFEYTCAYFQESIPFWKKSALEQRFVLFTVDQ